MSDKTGIARGTLSPVVYFERPDGYVIIPPGEIGKPGEIEREAYAKKYGPDGWMWREAGTLAEVDRLQKRLIDQEVRRSERMAVVNERTRAIIHEHTGDILKQRMISSSTSPWERDFIRAYLKLRNEKRDKYRDTLEHHNWYIWAREQDASTKVEDKLPLLPGQIERSGV